MIFNQVRNVDISWLCAKISTCKIILSFKKKLIQIVDNNSCKTTAIFEITANMYHENGVVG